LWQPTHISSFCKTRCWLNIFWTYCRKKVLKPVKTSNRIANVFVNFHIFLFIKTCQTGNALLLKS
jgi:hypothetical protein